MYICRKKNERREPELMVAERCNGGRPHTHALSVSKKTELKFKARSLLIGFWEIATENPAAPRGLEFKEAGILFVP